MTNRQFTHGGNIYQDSKDWLDFSANINPLGLAPQVRAAMVDHLDGVVHYPDPDGTALKDALAAYYGVATDQLLLGNGAAELFYTYFHAVPGQTVVLPVPTFSEYERAACAGRCRVTYVYTRPETGFALPWDELRQACGAADTIVLTNPNNPTGRLLGRDELLPFIAYAKEQGTQVVVDESFLDFRADRDAYSVMADVAAYENLLVYQSLTKFYAIPGVRLGFAVMRPALREQLEQHKDVWNVNVLAQYAGVAALAAREYQDKSRQYVAAERDFLARRLRQLPDVTVYDPSVNFILVRVGVTWGSAATVQDMLKGQGILVRNCDNYPGLDAQYIRVAVRTHEENLRLLQALSEIPVHA